MSCAPPIRSRSYGRTTTIMPLTALFLPVEHAIERMASSMEVFIPYTAVRTVKSFSFQTVCTTAVERSRCCITFPIRSAGRTSKSPEIAQISIDQESYVGLIMPARSMLTADSEKRLVNRTQFLWRLLSSRGGYAVYTSSSPEADSPQTHSGHRIDEHF